jgi:hypothetical protein
MQLSLAHQSGSFARPLRESYWVSYERGMRKVLT